MALVRVWHHFGIFVASKYCHNSIVQLCIDKISEIVKSTHVGRQMSSLLTRGWVLWQPRGRSVTLTLWRRQGGKTVTESPHGRQAGTVARFRDSHCLSRLKEWNKLASERKTELDNDKLNVRQNKQILISPDKKALLSVYSIDRYFHDVLEQSLQSPT